MARVVKMFQQLIRVLACIVFFLAMVTTTSCVNVQNVSYIPEKTTSPHTLLDEKIEYYRHLYPKITFLNLQNDDELPALDVVLGYQAKSLDYEHPPDLREDLMLVSVERIRLMLRSKQPSAAVFKADTPLGWQEHLCVLTINPDEVAADSIRATQHLLNLPQMVIQKIPYEMQLPPDDYLAFVINHEVYHCLKSIYVGPQLMSHKELWAGYNQFHNEQGADAYALAMHIKINNEDSIFANNLLRIRGMSLYNDDPDHLTDKALEQVLKIPAWNIAEMSSHEIFNMANHIKDHLTISYDEYVQYLASVVQAMKELGIETQMSVEHLYKLQDIQADPAQVKALVANARHYLADLYGDEFEQDESE